MNLVLGKEVLMRELNEKLLKIKSAMREKERLLRMLDNAEEQKRVLERKKAQLYEKLKKEELDVEKLEKISITNFINTITGRKLEKLEKEKKEAVAAKLKFDAVNEELKNLINGIERIEGSIWKLSNLESEYNTIINEKEKFLIFTDAEIENRLDRIIEEESFFIDKKKEIEEAIMAGKELLVSLKQVSKNLQSAGDWGTWDIIGGGTIVTMAKHSRIDQAKAEISKTQSLLSRFHRELEDVGGKVVDINIEIGSFLTFADFFFDGIFADLTVQSKIRDAEDRIMNTTNKVNGIMRRLEVELDETIRTIENLNNERLNIIEQA